MPFHFRKRLSRISFCVSRLLVLIALVLGAALTISSGDEVIAEEADAPAANKLTAQEAIGELDNPGIAGLWFRLTAGPRDAYPEFVRELMTPALKEKSETALWEPWRHLRLAALIRSGFPDQELLKRKIAAYRDSKLADSSVWPSLASELLLLTAIANLGSELLTKEESKVFAGRAERLVSPIAWPPELDQQSPSEERAATYFLISLCRKLTRDNQWGTPADNWSNATAAALKAFSASHLQPLLTRHSIRLVWAAGLALGADDPTLKLNGSDKRTLASLPKSIEEAIKKSPFESAPEVLSLLLLSGLGISGGKQKEFRKRILERQNQSSWTAKSATTLLVEAAGWRRKVWRPAPAGKDESKSLTEDFSWKNHLSVSAANTSEDALTLLSLFGSFTEPLRKGPDAPTFDEKVIKNFESAFAASAPKEFDEIVNEVLTRAGEWITNFQIKKGTFEGRFCDRQGGHALGLLILLKAGMKPESDPVERAVKALFKKPLSKLAGTTYDSALVLMALQALTIQDQQASGMLAASTKEQYKKAQTAMRKRLPKKYVSIIDEHAEFLARGERGLGWGYNGAATNKDYWTDNSNSQYAILGLKAASLLGAEYPRELFGREAQRLFEYYTPFEDLDEFEVDTDAREEGDKDDEKKTGTPQKIRPGYWCYSKRGTAFGAPLYLQWTASGIASLEICRDELKLAGLLDDATRRKIDLHIAGALRYLGERYAYRASRGWYATTYRPLSDGTEDQEGWNAYYSLYAIERAGVLSGKRLFQNSASGALDWYKEGAVMMCAAQEPDGSWPDFYKGRDDQAGGKVGDLRLIDVAFVMLFLKRSAIPTNTGPRYPITQRRKDKEEKKSKSEEGTGD